MNLCCLDLEKLFTEVRQVPAANRKLYIHYIYP